MKLTIIVLLVILIGYLLYDGFEPESIKGKNVIVTGASSGIGEQLAYHYARLGANIVITARREKRLKEVVEECKKIGNTTGQYHYISLDMSDENSTKKLIDFAVKKLDSIDILVLNHAWYGFEKWSYKDNDLKRLHQKLDVNFFSYASIASHAVPYLKKTNGSIIVSNSFYGQIATAFCTGYNSAKLAIRGFFGSLREELIMEGSDVSITMATIGYTETEALIDAVESTNINVKHFQGYFTASTASDTALALIKAGARRATRCFYPFTHTVPLIVSTGFFPDTAGKVIRFLWQTV